jgi:pilus assembly protein CpaC
VKKILITFFLAIITMAAHAVDSITMFAGEIKILEVGSIDRVAVGNGGLLSTSMLENGQLLILAEKEGETTVHIWYSDGAESDLKVQIVTNDNARVLQELRTLLSGMGDVEVKQVGERIFMTGSLLTTDNELLGTIKTAYPQLIDLTRKYDPEPAALVLPSQKMIYMNVKITEFNTSKLTELGIDWADFINGPSAGVVAAAATNNTFGPGAAAGVAPGFFGALTDPTLTGLGYFGIASQIVSTINLLVQTGDAVILAEPKLSARSGGKAEFLAGGEIPVVSAAGLGSTTVEYKEFGIKLEIEPVVDSLDNILARVATEVSAVNQSTPIGGDAPPAFITRKTSTDISMKDAETLVISGLVDRSLGNSVDKFPVLGDIPILGALFRSTRWNNNLTELVIFVTPTVYDAKSELNQERVQRREILIEQFKTAVEKDDLIID